MSKREYTARFITQADHPEANNREVNQPPIHVGSEREMTRDLITALKHGIATEITNIKR